MSRALAAVRRQLGRRGVHRSEPHHRPRDRGGLVRHLDRRRGQGRSPPGAATSAGALPRRFVERPRRRLGVRGAARRIATGPRRCSPRSAAAAEEAGDLDRASRARRERLALDPLSEEAARALIGRLVRTGDARAPSRLSSAAESLRRDLRLAPSPETRALVQEILEERDAPRSDAAGPPGGARALWQAARGRPPLQLDRLQRAGDARMRASRRWWRSSARPVRGKTRLIALSRWKPGDAGAAVLAGRCFEAPSRPMRRSPKRCASTPPVSSRPRSAGGRARAPRPDTPWEARAEGDPRDARHRSSRRSLRCATPPATGRSCLSRGPPLGRCVDPADAGPRGADGRAPHCWSSGSSDTGRARAGHLDTLLSDLRHDLPLDELVLRGCGRTTSMTSSPRLGARGRPALGERIHRRTRGNPLFVEESVRHLGEALPEPASPEELVAAATTGVPQGYRR